MQKTHKMLLVDFKEDLSAELVPESKSGFYMDPVHI